MACWRWFSRHDLLEVALQAWFSRYHLLEVSPQGLVSLWWFPSRLSGLGSLASPVPAEGLPYPTEHRAATKL